MGSGKDELLNWWKKIDAFFPPRDENRSEKRSGFVCQREFKELKNSLTHGVKKS